MLVADSDAVQLLRVLYEGATVAMPRKAAKAAKIIGRLKDHVWRVCPRGGVPDARVDELIKDYQGGVGWAAIEAKYQRARCSLGYHLKKRKIPVRD